jgi:hypothetical protein
MYTPSDPLRYLDTCGVWPRGDVGETLDVLDIL